MDFLRELYSLVPAGAPSKKKKKGGISMLPINSFLSGYIRPGNDDKDKDEDDEDGGGDVDESMKIVVPMAKPRHKQLNDALTDKKGGRHHDHKSDYSRPKEKAKDLKALRALKALNDYDD